MSELRAFDRVPDPPEGWRFVVSSDVDRADVRWWDSQAKDWKDCGAWSAGFPFDKDRTYIVPIDPPSPPDGYELANGDGPFNDLIFYCPIDKQWKPVPATSGTRKIEPGWYAVPCKPQYRPYNAAELKQTIGKLVDGVTGYRAMITGACGDSVYCQGQRVPSDQLLKNHTWTDGGKCGVKVD
jgi:hypothetical protein